MTRREFGAKVKLAAWERSGGRCEASDCGRKIVVGIGPEFHHQIPCELGGTNDPGNCVVLCIPCHRAVTKSEDMPRIVKARRLSKKAANIKPRSRPILGSKASGWKCPFNSPAHRRSP